MSDTYNSNNTWKDLFEKYITNACTKEELDELLLTVEDVENKEVLSHVLKDHWEKAGSNDNELSQDVESKFLLLMKEAKRETRVINMPATQQKKKRVIYYAAAVILICVFSLGAYLLYQPGVKKEFSVVENIKKEKEITPGGNRALLTLADGSTIILDSALNGTVTMQGNTKILKHNGKLSYESLSRKGSVALNNTISTPRGGQYELVLSDGSRVWLNAASSIRFPAAFVGKERRVELVGEAYFEVSKNKQMPFIVNVNGMEVEVLGTHFNINSYKEEAEIRTTLVEGSVKIIRNETSNMLKPGQQAQLNKHGDLRIIKNADVEEAIAWQEGNFQFDRADIYSVMRQISRWYDVEVEYSGTVTSHFVGTISRSVSLKQVLNMLHLTGGVKFKINDNKITVIP